MALRPAEVHTAREIDEELVSVLEGNEHAMITTRDAIHSGLVWNRLAQQYLICLLHAAAFRRPCRPWCGDRLRHCRGDLRYGVRARRVGMVGVGYG